MSILSSIFKLIKSIIKAIFAFIKKYLVIILLIIIIICAIYFAPMIATWLSSVGAPEFLVTAFEWVGTSVTPLLSSLWEGIASVGSGAWTAFTGASLGVKAAVVTGLAASIAPEETAALLADVGAAAGDIAGGIISGLASTPVGLLALGLGAYWLFGFFSKGKQADKKTEEEVDAGSAYVSPNGGVYYGD